MPNSTNDGTISGSSQIEVNPVSGYVINFLKYSGSGSAAENLACNSCYLSPSGLISGQSIFNGAITGGVALNGGHIVIGSGSMFGSISTPQSGYPPAFYFRNTFINGTVPSSTSNYLVALENVTTNAGVTSSGSGVNLNSQPGERRPSISCVFRFKHQREYRQRGRRISIDHKLPRRHNQVSNRESIGRLFFRVRYGPFAEYLYTDASGELTFSDPLSAADPAPIAATGTGAGTGGTVTLSACHTNSCQFSVTSGTTPAASSTLVTVTFAASLGNGCHAVLSPVGSAAGALQGTSAMPFINNIGGTYSGFTVNSNIVALAASTTYVFNYLCL